MMSTLQQSVSVLLVDDEPQFRQGLKTLMNFYNTSGSFQLKPVGEAATVEQVVKLAKEQHPTLILMDLELMEGNGVTALLRLGEIAYKGKTLVLSGHCEDEWVFRAMQAGACGYVVKDRLATELCTAIATVIQGEVYLSPELATRFFRLFHFYAGRTVQACQTVHLTEREQEVLHWLVQGASNDEISGRLYITVATVKAHLTAIFEKLSVTSRTQAIVKALKMGLVCA
jgi:DNA-binding NarL/FixJ family response regulator